MEFIELLEGIYWIEEGKEDNPSKYVELWIDESKVDLLLQERARLSEISGGIDSLVGEYLARQKTIKSKIKSIENSIQFAWLSHSDWVKYRYESVHWFVKFSKNPPSVLVLDKNIIPQEFIKEKTELSINKIKIKEALNAGVQVPGAELSTGIFRLSIT